MTRGGHNWKGGRTVEGTRSLDVIKLARAGYVGGAVLGGWQWIYRDGEKASIQIVGGRDSVTLKYLAKLDGEDWVSVEQAIPIQWLPCRFGGERPWFVCAVHADGVYCGRRVTKLFGAGRLFACRSCYRLGYRSQRGDRMDQAHNRLGRLHRKLGGDYTGPDDLPPSKPKWMRHRTYDRVVDEIDAGRERLETVFNVGAALILARLDKVEQRVRTRR